MSTRGVCDTGSDCDSDCCCCCCCCCIKATNSLVMGTPLPAVAAAIMAADAAAAESWMAFADVAVVLPVVVDGVPPVALAVLAAAAFHNKRCCKT